MALACSAGCSGAVAPSGGDAFAIADGAVAVSLAATAGGWSPPTEAMAWETSPPAPPATENGLGKAASGNSRAVGAAGVPIVCRAADAPVGATAANSGTTVAQGLVKSCAGAALDSAAWAVAVPCPCDPTSCGCPRAMWPRGFGPSVAALATASAAAGASTATPGPVPSPLPVTCALQVPLPPQSGPRAPTAAPGREDLLEDDVPAVPLGGLPAHATSSSSLSRARGLTGVATRPLALSASAALRSSSSFSCLRRLTLSGVIQPCARSAAISACRAVSFLSWYAEAARRGFWTLGVLGAALLKPATTSMGKSADILRSTSQDFSAPLAMKLLSSDFGCSKGASMMSASWSLKSWSGRCTEAPGTFTGDGDHASLWP
mmetsp:Transcript_67141/g.185971  ORF Transcript_67141/g.185971 Transcript_67141/m.185971 type:complete len:376 (-) Transcript_67141:528-1655(-)